ncbi:MAG TPA: rRNA maturation RNase YbeY [Armatimonadota bacterium]|nr:rRNA maturation RNase YbeY [Armatimonadota bacterium]
MDREKLIRAAEKSLQVEQFDKSAEISIVLVDDERMQELNREYRKADRPTDVLAFSQLEGEPAKAPEDRVALGDVVVSIDTAERQAAEQGHALENELDLLIIHGVLHLLGYDDEAEADAAEMRRHEKRILDELK